MKQKAKKKTVYYEDALQSDFAGTNIKARRVDKNFKYIHRSILWRIASAFLYYCIAFPVVFFYERAILRVRFVNRKALRPYKKDGCFIYGNHTGFYDAYTPNLLSFPHRNRIIVSADAVSIKGLSSIVQMLGAIPLPGDLRGRRNFMEAVRFHIENGSNITIYPEAHIWPYYTGVRPFPDTSFYYPAKFNAPTFAFFTAYTRPRGVLSCLRKANMTVYVSDPILPDPALPLRERRRDIRDKVYRFMQEKAKLSDYAVIRYLPISEKEHADL